MEKLSLMLSVAGTVLGLLITTLTATCKWVKNSKAKTVAENIIKISNFILPYIEKAETFISFTGEEKKAYVMTKANQYAIDNGIKFDEEQISSKIDELVALSKLVNANDTKEGQVTNKSIEKENYSNFDENIKLRKQKNIIE